MIGQTFSSSVIVATISIEAFLQFYTVIAPFQLPEMFSRAYSKVQAYVGNKTFKGGAAAITATAATLALLYRAAQSRSDWVPTRIQSYVDQIEGTVVYDDIAGSLDTDTRDSDSEKQKRPTEEAPFRHP